MFARLIAITNGDCAAVPVEFEGLNRSVLVEGTMSPATKMPIIYRVVRG
jgi:hypothetical protein